MAAEYAIEMRGITKTFGSVVANKDVNLTLRKGEILALLGENGSGKTTLMNMLSGIYQPDSGEILVDGTPVSIRSPQEAKTLGIGMVHQHFKLVDVFTAADNIWMGREKPGFDLKRGRYDEIRGMLSGLVLKSIPRKKGSQYGCFQRSRPWRSSRYCTMGLRSLSWMSPLRCSPFRRSTSYSPCCGG